MASVRPPAVAGMFYPAEREELGRWVRGALARAPGAGAPAPKALIAPHAGYVYSGEVAARAYAFLAPVREAVTRVVLAGPSHRLAFDGLAVPSARAFLTPLGEVPVDEAAVKALLGLPQVRLLDQAHAGEHGLEVHLPFLQAALASFSIVPMVVGRAPYHAVAEALELVWGGPETLIVVSSDLSHYHDYATARRMDAETSAAIERLDGAAIGPDQACGRIPVGGLIEVARNRGMKVRTVDLRNSGDTAGARDRVVGYGAWLFA